MWKYIITWCVVTMGTDATFYESTDQFGRTQIIEEHYYYAIDSDCDHKMEFFDRDSAYQFYHDARYARSTYSLMGEVRIDTLKIDSVKIASIEHNIISDFKQWHPDPRYDTLSDEEAIRMALDAAIKLGRDVDSITEHIEGGSKKK